MPISAFRSASRALAAASSSGVELFSTSPVAPPTPAISTAARRSAADRRRRVRCTSCSACSSPPESTRSVGFVGVIVNHGARRSISFAMRAAARCQNDVEVAARSRHDRSTCGSAALRCSARRRASARAASCATRTASLVRCSRASGGWLFPRARGSTPVRVLGRRASITACAAESIGSYGWVRASGRFGSAFGAAGIAAVIRAWRSRFPSSQRARALIFATATGSIGTLMRLSGSGVVRSITFRTGGSTSRSTAGYVSGASTPLAGIRVFTARFASSAVIAIATRSSGDIESRVAEIPPRSSVRDAAPGASSGSMMVDVRPSVVRRAAIATPLVRATSTSLRERATRPTATVSPSCFCATVNARRARSAGLADASLS